MTYFSFNNNKGPSNSACSVQNIVILLANIIHVPDYNLVKKIQLQCCHPRAFWCCCREWNLWNYKKIFQVFPWLCFLNSSKNLPFLVYKYMTAIICYNNSESCIKVFTATFSCYYPKLNKNNNQYIDVFTSPPPDVPCIVLFGNNFQFITTTKIKNQVFQKS